MFGIDHGQTFQSSFAVDQLKEHGMTALSEMGDLTPDISRTIIEKAM